MVAQLYPLYFEELTRFLTGLLKSRAAAEDVAQETFLRALEHAEQFEAYDRAACRAWLYRTAKRICVDRFRRRSRAPLPEDGAFREDDHTGPEVAELIALLPAHERALFALNAFEGYSAKELADQFGLKPATVRQRLCSARARLRQWYGGTEL